MNFRFQTGVIFILVTFFILIVSLISLYFLQQTLCVHKMAYGIREQCVAESKSQIYVWEREKALKIAKKTGLSEPFGFVPDHLAFECDEGYYIFKITKKPYQAFIGLHK